MEHATSIVDVRTVTILFSFILRPSFPVRSTRFPFNARTLSLVRPWMNVRGRPKTAGRRRTGWKNASKSPSGSGLGGRRSTTPLEGVSLYSSSITCWYRIPVTAYTRWHGGKICSSSRHAGNTLARTQIDVLYCKLSAVRIRGSPSPFSLSFSLSLSLGCYRRRLSSIWRVLLCLSDAAFCIFFFFPFFFFFGLSLPSFFFFGLSKRRNISGSRFHAFFTSWIRLRPRFFCLFTQFLRVSKKFWPARCCNSSVLLIFGRLRVSRWMVTDSYESSRFNFVAFLR